MRTEIAGIPVLADAASLAGDSPVVVVIHGMSTTAETLQAGWPEDPADGLAKVYWRLPILREGREAVMARRDADVFQQLFWPVVSESRAELSRLLDALGPRAKGLFGFSIGGFLALWGAIDNPQIRASVAVGGVPYLEYLLQYYPDYHWQDPDVKEKRASVDLRSRLDSFASVSTLILHGEVDEQANPDWMLPFAEALHAANPVRHAHSMYPHVQHRLTGATTPEEEASLHALRTRATQWFQSELAL